MSGGVVQGDQDVGDAQHWDDRGEREEDQDQHVQDCVGQANFLHSANKLNFGLFHDLEIQHMRL